MLDVFDFYITVPVAALQLLFLPENGLCTLYDAMASRPALLYPAGAPHDARKAGIVLPLQFQLFHSACLSGIFEQEKLS
jgi:hypothetical protein